MRLSPMSLYCAVVAIPAASCVHTPSVHQSGIFSWFRPAGAGFPTPSPEKDTDDTDDEFCVIDKLATVGHTDDNTVVIETMDITEVPDEDDNIPQIENELDSTT